MSVIKKLKYKIYLKRDLKRRLRIIKTCQIDTIFDVGANTGQYAQKMRNLGYNKKIISFEPVASAYETLKICASRDKNWMVNLYALGDENTTGVINISGSSDNSSILDMLPKHFEDKPELKYVGQQSIEIKTLDAVFDSFVDMNNRVMVKIDTQGYEKNVIDGAINSLAKIRIIQLEMSIVPLYKNEMLLTEMIRYLEDKGFQLFSIENGYYNKKTGQLLQVDGIFVNKNLYKK